MAATEKQAMKANELKPGTFFEFDASGFVFGRCLWVGIDDYSQMNFVHKIAGGDKFAIHSDVSSGRNPAVTTDVPQCWKEDER